MAQEESPEEAEICEPPNSSVPEKPRRLAPGQCGEHRGTPPAQAGSPPFETGLGLISSSFLAPSAVKDWETLEQEAETATAALRME